MKLRLHCKTAVIAMAVAAATICAGSASAQIFQRGEAFRVSADDAALLQSIQEAVRSIEPERLDDALMKLQGEPGLTDKQRLMILSFRSAAMISRSAPSQAVELIRAETLARPDDPLAQMVLAHTAFAAGDYTAVANAVIAVTRLQPAAVDQLSAYELKILFDRLATTEQHDLSNTLARRLFDVGWSNGYVGLRSSAAKDVVLDLLEKGDVEASRRYVVEIEIPAILAMMLSDRRYTVLRPTITDWAGARLEKQWPIYLAEAKRSFESMRSATTADDYASALVSARNDTALLATFFPFAEQQFVKTQDEEWIFTIIKVASTLARQGRWDEAFASLDRVSKLLGKDSQNAINISANRARLRLMKGDFEEASRLFVPVLEEARANEGVGPTTMAWLESYRLCALHQQGSAQAMAEATRYSEIGPDKKPSAMAWTWLCLDQPAAARDAWLSAAGDPEELVHLLAFVQPDSEVAYDSTFARDMEQRIANLRNQPALRSAVANAGDIRTWRLTETAPRE